MDIDVLLYDGFDELDAIGPFEVLANGGFIVSLTALEGARPVPGAHGAVVMAQRTPGEAPGVLLVPGGGWNDGSAAGARAEHERGDVPRAIAARHAAGSRIASVCTGAMLLASAGLLAGRPATTHRSAIEDLRAAGAEIKDARVVDAGDVVTSGGVTCGLDLALWLVEQEHGPRVAARIEGAMEHTRRGTVWR